MSLTPRLSNIAICLQGNAAEVLILDLLGGHGLQSNSLDLIHQMPGHFKQDLVVDQSDDVNTREWI